MAIPPPRWRLSQSAAARRDASPHHAVATGRDPLGGGLAGIAAILAASEGEVGSSPTQTVPSPNGVSILPSRRVWVPLTRGLSFPHGGRGSFYLPQRRRGAMERMLPMWKCGNVEMLPMPMLPITNWNWILELGTGNTGNIHSLPCTRRRSSLRRLASSPAGVGVLPCTGV